MSAPAAWSLVSLKPSGVVAVDVGEPVVPPLVHHCEFRSAYSKWNCVDCAEGLTVPERCSLVAPVPVARPLFTVGVPAVNGVAKPCAVPLALVAEIAAQ